MEEDSTPGKDDADKFTVWDAGRGLIFIGSVILFLTGLFFFLSLSDQKLFGLFSGRNHLAFDTFVGLAFLGIGLVLVRKGKPVHTESTQP